MSSFLPKLAILGAAFATGNLLRSSGVLTKEDAKVDHALALLPDVF